MEYQNNINLLVNKPNQSTKFKTKSWIEAYDEPWGTYDTGNQLDLKLQC